MQFPSELDPVGSGFGSIIHCSIVTVNDGVENLKDLFTIGTLTKHGQHEGFGHD